MPVTKEQGSDDLFDRDNRNKIDQEYADYIKDADEEERLTDTTLPMEDADAAAD
jgi:hypothetical protein